MKISISGLALNTASCSSLKAFKQFIITGEDCEGNGTLTPSQVAIEALEDGEVNDYDDLFFITSPHSDLLDLPDRLKLKAHQYQVVQSEQDSDLDPLLQAGLLIQEDPNRKVLLGLTSGSGTIALLLTHPEGNHLAYAELDPVQDANKFITGESEGDPGPITYFHLNQGTETLNQDAVNRIHELVPERGPDSIALGWMDPKYTKENELLQIIFTAVMLHQKSIPGSPGGLQDNLVFPQDSPYYLAEGSRPWFDQGQGFIRTAFVYAPEKGYLGWKLTEPKRPRSIPILQTSITGVEPHLILVPGNTIAEVLGGLQELETSLLGENSIKTIAKNAYAKFSGGNYTNICCLISSNLSDLQKEISFAKQGIQKGKKSNGTWSSPKGSYFTANPLGGNGLAFVYPGAFNSYPGMGRHLFNRFPNLHQAIREIIPDISHSLSERQIFPRIIPQHPVPSPQERMDEFFNHPNELIESGISISVLHTMILKEIFQVQPQAAFGYSLGEVSMLWANKVWGNAVKSSLDWSESPLFKNQLFGEMTTLREFWQDQPLGEDFWGSYILKAPIHTVQSALDKESQVFLTIINTENEVVIAGWDEACQRVINEVKCHALPMPFNASIHNPGIQARFLDFVDLYRNEVVEKPGMQFYSASDYAPLDLTSDSLANSMAKMTCSPVDFPRLVRKAYQDGIRIFIEVGPQKTCSRWIEKILESNPHAVIPINKKHQPDYAGILKVLSLLISHTVPLDLSPLFSSLEDGVIPVIPDPSFEPQEDMIQPESSELDLTFLEHISRISADVTRSQEEFLNHQAVITKNIKRILSLRESTPGLDQPEVTSLPPLYTEEQIIAFTRGDHRDCFGDLYSEFEDRRIPRLPNGPLRFIDRVMDLKAEKGKVVIGSSLVSQLDLPTQDWYLSGSGGSLPYVSLMEAALQPCGFLSAYMGSIRNRSKADLYFRNLDGEFSLLFWPNLLGSTITNRVVLTSASTLQDVIIQEYSFELSHEGKPFLRGKSSFGYFTPHMLKNQSGLNGKDALTPWKSSHPDSGRWVKRDADISPRMNANKPHLPHIPRVWLSNNGGNSKAGYIQAKVAIPSDAWFFQAHFYQDPVMPGSLGVESMFQTLAGSTASLGTNPGAKWRIRPGSKTSWKYRGQITPGVDSVEIELHIKELHKENARDQISADGNLWLGNTRIYEVKNISLETY